MGIEYQLSHLHRPAVPTVKGFSDFYRCGYKLAFFCPLWVMNAARLRETRLICGYKLQMRTNYEHDAHFFFFQLLINLLDM